MQCDGNSVMQRQTDLDRQADSWTDRQIVEELDRQLDQHRYIVVDGWIARQTKRQLDRQTD